MGWREEDVRREGRRRNEAGRRGKGWRREGEKGEAGREKRVRGEKGEVMEGVGMVGDDI